MAVNILETQSTEYQRGRQFVPQGIGGYDENWYPLCLSSEVKPGEVKGVEYLNGRVIVFRKKDGSVSVMSAYCRHLGVDLSQAKVIEDTVRCPYHHWQYDGTGRCVKTAVGDTPPTRAKLFEFPVAESLGLIWAYNGDTPAYEVPAFELDESELEVLTKRAVEVPMDSFMLFSNSMDLQHLISLHQAKFEKYPEEVDIGERSLEYVQDMVLPRLGPTKQSVKLLGTNCIILSSKVMGRQTYMMATGLTVKGPMTKTFNISATIKAGSKLADKKSFSRFMDKILINYHLKMVDAFITQLNEEDDPILRTMSPRLDTLSASDKYLGIYFDYAKRYPRSNIAEDLICNDYINAAPK